MKTELHEDQSVTVYFGRGDKAIYIGPSDWFLHRGELVNILRVKTSRNMQRSSIDFLDVQTDEHKKELWGSTSVAPWDLAPSLTGDLL